MEMESVIYVCGECNKPLEENSLQNHDCWQNVLIEPVANEAGDVENEETLEDVKGDEEENDEDVNNENNSIIVCNPETSMKQPTAIKSRRGKWTEEDVHRLIRIYIKNCKLLPKQDGMNNHYFWDRVMKDLKPYGDFSRFLVQTKIKRLKNAAQTFANFDPNTKWPFFQEMCQLLSIENQPTFTADLVSQDDDDDNNDSDNNTYPSDEVKGLRRWTVKETRHLLQVYKKHLPNISVNRNRKKTPWNAIIADLQYDLPKRFSTIQIRSRIRNVLSTYRAIIAHKRKKQMTHWPLFKDVAQLVTYQMQFSTDSLPSEFAISEEFIPDDDADADDRHINWNIEETQELIAVYLQHITEIKFAITDEERRVIWDKITQQVNSIRRRKVSSAAAQNKINTLRLEFNGHDQDQEGRTLGPLYDHVKMMVDTERLYNPPRHQLYSSRGATKKRKRSHYAEHRETDKKLPQWYIKYSQDAERRHSEKIAVHRSIIETLEKILAAKK